MSDIKIPRGILIDEFSEITGIGVEMLRDWHKKGILRANTNRSDGIESYLETLVDEAIKLFERQKYYDANGYPPLTPNEAHQFRAKYRNVCDLHLMNTDNETFRRKNDYAESLIQDVDFTKNLLFTHNLDVGREFFLHGLLKHAIHHRSHAAFLKNELNIFKSYFLATPDDLVTIHFFDKAYAMSRNEWG